MGMRPPKFCGKCHKTALPGSNRCALHPMKDDRAQRNNLRPLYKCRRWYQTRAHVLARDPICTHIEHGVQCLRLSTDADHIVDAVTWTAAGFDFYDTGNLRGLCHAHHSRRTALEQQAQRRAQR